MFEAAVLLVLLAAWAVVLLPSVLRSRTQSTHITVGGFAESMQALRRHAEGRELMVPGHPDRIVNARARDGHETIARPVTTRQTAVVTRRRQWFTRLVGATVGSLALALVVGGLTWSLFAATALVAGGYVAMLRTLKIQRDESRRVVHHIDHPNARWAYESDVHAEPGYDVPRHDVPRHDEPRYDEPLYDDRYVDDARDWREPVAVGAGGHRDLAVTDRWGDSRATGTTGVRIRRF